MPMDERIDLRLIDQYSKRYSTRVLDAIFAEKKRVSGAELKALCDVDQVNFFVLRELLGAWRAELTKLKSPFFEYDHREVKDALDEFMRILSNHIAVNRGDFQPLLERAVSKTILIVLAPYDFFSTLVEGEENKLEIRNLKEDLRYLKINRAPLVRLLEKLDEKKVTTMPGNEAFALLDQILEEVNFNPDDVEPFIEKLSAVEPFDVASFYEQKAPVRQAPAKEKKQSPATINEKLKKEAAHTLADDFQKIPRIKDKLTINQKFMFTKVLFKGDFDSFSKTVEMIDRLENLTAAMKYLDNLESNWDRESDEYAEFMELVEKRFS